METLFVLVPHRDIRVRLRVYSESLFSAGLSGAWSFPWVSPLAVLSEALSPVELKQMAFIIREQGIGRGEKIKCGNSVQVDFPHGKQQEGVSVEKIALYGPTLNLTMPDSAISVMEKKIIHRFSPLIIGAAILQGNEKLPDSQIIPQPPELSFRAAALANMIFQPLSSTWEKKMTLSFKWKIEKLYWLPSS